MRYKFQVKTRPQCFCFGQCFGRLAPLRFETVVGAVADY